jgi:hypothetical protein
METIRVEYADIGAEDFLVFLTERQRSEFTAMGQSLYAMRLSNDDPDVQRGALVSMEPIAALLLQDQEHRDLLRDRIQAAVFEYSSPSAETLLKGYQAVREGRLSKEMAYDLVNPRQVSGPKVQDSPALLDAVQRDCEWLFQSDPLRVKLETSPTD